MDNPYRTDPPVCGDREHRHPGKCELWARDTAEAPKAAEPATEVVTEYGERLTSGGYQTWNTEPHIERIYPLAGKIEAHREQGKVYRRRIILVEDWVEVDAP